MFSSILDMPWIGIDFETITDMRAGPKPYIPIKRGGDKIFAYSIIDSDGNVRVVRNEDHTAIVDELNDIFSDTSTAKVAHNYKYELSVALTNGIVVPKETVWHDTMIMHQELRNDATSHALDYLGFTLFGIDRRVDSEVHRIARQLGSMHLVPRSTMDEYQKRDVERVWLLANLLTPKLMEIPKLYEDYCNEIDLVAVTERMERRGILLDYREARRLHQWCAHELEKVSEDVFDKFGQYINLMSPKQLSKLLFVKLGMEPIAYSDAGNPKTDKDTIEELERLCPKHTDTFDLLRRQRAYTKGKAITKGYIDAANDDNGIVHPNIHTNKARTGRQACSNPNLQNVSKSAVQKIKYPIPARKCYRCRDGFALVAHDYKGIEIRLIAFASGDEEMIRIIRNGGDPHDEATKIFYATNDFTKEQRSAAKNGQFALAYGAGPGKIAATCGIDASIFKPRYEEYCERFTMVANFSKSLMSQVREQGFIVTPFGRRLRIPRDKAYEASNYMIQSTAAKILKYGQVSVDRWIHGNPDIYMLLPVHDELINEVSIDIVENPSRFRRYKIQITNRMTRIPNVTVPLAIDTEISYGTWEDSKKEVDE